MVVSAQSSSISTNQHSFLSSVADTVLVGHPYGTSARDRSCHTTANLARVTCNVFALSACFTDVFSGAEWLGQEERVRDLPWMGQPKPGHVRGRRVGEVLRPLRCHSVKGQLGRPQDCWLWLAQEHRRSLLVLKDKVVIWSPRKKLNSFHSNSLKPVAIFCIHVDQ